jgi:hypothetical protein
MRWGLLPVSLAPADSGAHQRGFFQQRRDRGIGAKPYLSDSVPGGPAARLVEPCDAAGAARGQELVQIAGKRAASQAGHVISGGCGPNQAPDVSIALLRAASD